MRLSAVMIETTDPAERRVSHYRVLHSIGSGGMGDVFLGLDETLKRKVALKSIRAEHRISDLAKARFLREARILSQLDHPCICRALDYIEEPDGDWLVLEYIEGRSLRDALKAGLPAATQLRIAEQIAGVLVVTHAAGIVHRDLKPGNVMLLDSGDIKVLDVGLACLYESGTGTRRSGDDRQRHVLVRPRAAGALHRPTGIPDRGSRWIPDRARPGGHHHRRTGGLRRPRFAAASPHCGRAIAAADSCRGTGPPALDHRYTEAPPAAAGHRGRDSPGHGRPRQVHHRSEARADRGSAGPSGCRAAARSSRGSDRLHAWRPSRKAAASRQTRAPPGCQRQGDGLFRSGPGRVAQQRGDLPPVAVDLANRTAATGPGGPQGSPRIVSRSPADRHRT